MRLLVLGGTMFVGRHLVDAALRRGHDVTLFNRGHTNPELFPEVERLRGDRASDLAALEGRRWDAVIDTSGYLPAAVAASAELLMRSVERYAFISTVAVYDDFAQPGLDESARVARLPPGVPRELADDTYGPLKALCERAVRAAFSARALVIRPGIIAGPHDPTDRFTYWVRRVAQGGEVSAPGNPDRPVQLIDARDLADWIVRMVERGEGGTFNATGPDRELGFGELLDECKAASGSEARFVWVSDEVLRERGAEPFDLPFWNPDPDSVGFFAIDSSKAVARGLSFRPLVETARDTLRWDLAREAAR
jgi:2'-hydroxyisoflavone reductase